MMVQACTEMVMPMVVSNESMFPPSSFSYEETERSCQLMYGVKPRPHWITTEFGGNVSYIIYVCSLRFWENILPIKPNCMVFSLETED